MIQDYLSGMVTANISVHAYDDRSKRKLSLSLNHGSQIVPHALVPIYSGVWKEVNLTIVRGFPGKKRVRKYYSYFVFIYLLERCVKLHSQVKSFYVSIR